MAVVSYKTVQKPLDECLIDAACVYYECDREFLLTKKKGWDVDKRRTLHWLLWTDAQMDFSAIAEKFGYHKSTMQEGIETIDFRMSVYPSITRDINNIRKIAGTLKAELEVSVDIKLKTVFDGEVHEGSV